MLRRQRTHANQVYGLGELGFEMVEALLGRAQEVRYYGALDSVNRKSAPRRCVGDREENKSSIDFLR